MLTGAMEGAAAGLILHGPGMGAGNLFATHGYSAEAIDTYRLHFSGTDGRQREMASAPAGTLLADGHNLDFNAYRRTRIYNEFFGPRGLGHGMGVALFAGSGRIANFSMLRAAERGPFATADLRVMAALAPHLRRALQVHEQLAHTTAMGEGLTSALNHLAAAVFLVTTDGRLAFMNAAAERLVAQPSCPISLRNGRLEAKEGAQASMAHLFADCISSAGLPPRVLRLARPDGLPPVGLMAMPVCSSSLSGAGAGPYVLVFASTDARPPDAGLLVEQFGLTPAEAAVTIGLMQDQDAAAIARARGVGEGTVRAQVKAVLAKTGTHSQRQLAALIARSLAMFSLDR